ncbi:hypothetical protein GCM10028797_06180 [Dyella agri]
MGGLRPGTKALSCGFWVELPCDRHDHNWHWRIRALNLAGASEIEWAHPRVPFEEHQADSGERRRSSTGYSIVICVPSGQADRFLALSWGQASIAARPVAGTRRDGSLARPAVVSHVVEEVGADFNT